MMQMGDDLVASPITPGYIEQLEIHFEWKLIIIQIDEYD